QASAVSVAQVLRWQVRDYHTTQPALVAVLVFAAARIVQPESALTAVPVSYVNAVLCAFGQEINPTILPANNSAGRVSVQDLIVRHIHLDFALCRWCRCWSWLPWCLWLH